MDGRKLSAALLICLCFGSIHAYGVLLFPIELWLGTSRTMASLGYAAAIASLTAGVFLNGRLDRVSGTRLRLIGCGSLAALGLLLLGAGHSVTGLILGYGAMYGLANGIAYATSLSLAASAMPGREARAIGLATAVYGLGAVLWAQFFAWSLRGMPVATLFMFMAPLLFGICLFCAAVMVGDPASRDEAASVTAQSGRPSLPPLWVIYLLGALGGLMVLAHAPAIAVWRGGETADAGVFAGIVSGGSVAGGYLGGLSAERFPGRMSLAAPLIVQTGVLASLPALTGLFSLLAALGLTGLCYGVLIAVIPAEVRRRSGPNRFAADYGRVFSAWGVAGLAGPVVAGTLYDLSQGYGVALAGASALSLLSVLLVFVSMPK